MDDSTFRKLKESNYYHPEITDMLDVNQMSLMTWHSVNIGEKGYDILWDKSMAFFIQKYFTDGLKILENQTKEKGLKLRLIVEATAENINFVNSLNFSEIRHLDGIRGNFAIFDERAYMLQIFHRDTGQPDQGFWSNSRVLVDKQQKLFDYLWEMSLPLAMRDKELKFQARQQYKKILTEDYKIQQEITSLVEQSRKELLIFSSSIQLDALFNRSNFMNLLILLLKKNVIIRILTDDINQYLLNYIYQINDSNKDNQIQFGYSKKLGNFSELIIISDDKNVLQIKFNEGNNLEATVSNEEHTKLVQAILFEKYWNEVKSLEVINGN